MRYWGKYIFIAFCFILAGDFYTMSQNVAPLQNQKKKQDATAPKDTVKTLYPVAKIVPEDYKELKQSHPIDLTTPAIFSDDFQYNPKTNRYELRSKIGDMDISTPLIFTREEYYEYSMKKSMDSYFRNKYSEEFQQKDSTKKDALSLFDFKFDLGPAEKIFGPGGVKLTPQGSVLTKFGFTHTSTGNPTLTERQRSRLAFDFDSQIEANVAASVGDKVNFDLNYNTESTFDYDTRKMKLGYTGKEDEIVKVLEAGNVSMNTTNSLIRGGSALFGIKTELQFGKLTVGAIFSQQESQSRSISTKGTVQTTPFEIPVDKYDENMHYYLGHYFRDNYDEAMSSLPYIKSGINIDRIEVWITNKRSNYNEARNIVAFPDLGEHDHISNARFTQATGTEMIPYNNANNLYAKLISAYPDARDISMVNQVFEGTPMVGGHDYEKIENARKLEPGEYHFSSQLGYISLRTPLQPDEVLAVAYSYIYRGVSYQVGEFSTDNPGGSDKNLFVKAIKGSNVSPISPTWKLMMRNVYTIAGNRNIEKEKFRLNIKYQNDTTGVFLNYITEGAIANKLLLSVMNLDRLDSKNEPYPDGFFDFVENYTVISQTGKIIFPVAEPFGEHLRRKIGDDEIASKYVFQELYDSTLTVARQTAEKNKFIIQGEYKGAAGSNLQMNEYGGVARGSVVVTANGVRLKENVDYIVDYSTGGVTIINPAYENANIDMSSEDTSGFNMQRKTMTGMNLNYAINPKFNIGATIMNLSEMPLTMKTEPGQESLNNTLFGFNTNYATQSQALTNLLDKLPLIELTAPSQITFTAEYAQLKPGHYQSKYGGNYSYIDDFEQAKMPIDLRSPYSWFLSSTPSMFNESRFSNNIDYGKNRSLLAWYYIDGLFTRKSSLTPVHIKNDNDQLSNHYVREILETEIYPDKDQRFNESTSIQVLNLAYYPTERGPYNLDDEEIDVDGKLLNPEKRWAGITRKIESGNTDFEAQNIETIEFWLLDPFIYKPNSSGGDLYINLGEVSEDILKDEKKFFENGLPIDKDTAKVEKTVWGLVPKQQSLVYAFDNTEGARKLQDVGLNGLSSEEELTYSTYANYLSNLQRKLTPEKMDEFRKDPAGDNFHYFRGSDYDATQTPILARYKHYNGTEGNSADNSDSSEKYSTAAKLVPDVEDINQDNTLNETENYFQYHISLNPKKMNVGENFIVQKREVKPYLKNGKDDETVTWYQFKVPIQSFTDKQGNINDFRTIRFMRMFMTGFSDSIVLRFGSFELVRGEWRTYTKELSAHHGNASLSISTVNIEENGSKEPVNYIMPPGVNRILDPSQPQLRQQNEQAMSMKIIGLETGDARAIYKTSGLDSRQYRRIQMFAHAEKLPDDLSDLQDNDLSIFLRLGSDYKNNYYEYEIPVKVTPPERYIDTNASRETVWPQSNMFDFPFELLTNLKLTRNQEKRKAGSDVTYYTPFSGIDPEKPMNRVTIVGNPTISNIKVIMIGVRNNSKSAKSTEVWVNELRLTDFNEDGGWAGNANLFVGLSDLGSVNLTGKKETTGFGSLDQGIMERNLDDRQQMNVSTQVDIGKFFPEKAKVNIPMYYSYTEDVISPKYNPLDQDVLMKDALDAAGSKVERDSIKGYSQDKVTTRSINFNNVSVDVRSKKPMPYDPSNLTMSYSFVENYKQDATTEYEHSTGNDFNLNYSYSPPIKPWKPFDNKPKNANLKKTDSKKQKTDSIPKPKVKPASNSPMAKFIREFEIGLLPKTIHLNSEITRSYFEIQLRDLGSQAENMLPASFREDFFWNRSTDLQWSLTKNLNLTFNSGTNARIESPHVQVNKKFNPDQYSLWKDSVLQSIRDLGTPLEYKQTFSAIYTVPFQAIPALNFINAGLKFNSGYEWNKGAMIDDPDIQIGNVIQNHRDMGVDNVTFNMLNLYNKSKFLNEVNKKYSGKKPTAAPRRNNNSAQKENEANKTKEQDAKKAATEKRKKKFEGNIVLNTDSATVVKHQLDNTNLRITARNEAGKLYKLKFKTIDNNSIRIKSKDSMNLKLIISQLPPRDESSLYKLAQGTARVAMMVRSVGFSYNQGFEMMVPNFSRNIDNFLGQGSSPYGKAPGFDFAFGMVGTGFLDKVRKNNWLIKNDANITPAMYNNTHTFNFTALLEPVVGMRVNLTGTRTSTNRNEVYFMYDGAPNKLSGDFRMSTIALSSAFESMNANNGYYSKAFETFLSNRQKIARRLEGIYQRTSFPDAGFLAGNPEYVGNSYNPDIHGPIDANSTDVLIPAFIAAYTGKNPKSVGLSAFPSLKNLLPNWAVTYDGLLQIPAINKNFKTFTLEHTYSSTYAVGMFNSFLGWVGADNDGIGFIENVTTGRPYPSSPYDITAVSISEAFNPLIGVNSTLLNNMSFKLQYNAKRNVNLNVSAYQIVEMHENNITFGTGYRFDNFNKVLKIKKTGGANFNNEMKFSADIAFNRTQTLIRKIEDNLTQATSGNSNTTLKLKADYNLSKMITMQAFFDRQLTMPLISANAYPVAKSSFGVSVKINLTR